MTVSPQGRPSKAELSPSPTGQTADPPSNPPTLLRLPNLDPARSMIPDTRSAEASSTSVIPEAPRETSAPAAEPTPESVRSDEVPFGPIEKPAAATDSPIRSSYDANVLRDDGHANLPTEKLAATLETDPVEAQPTNPRPTNPQPPRVDGRWYPEPPASTRDSGSDPRRLPPRQTPVRQDEVPEGRSWMERLGSQSIVLIVLVALAAAAIVAGHQRESGVESPSGVAAEDDARVADTHTSGNRRANNLAAARSESPEERLADDPPNTPRSPNASSSSGSNQDPEQASAQREHTRSKVAARFAHQRPFAENRPLARDSPAELNAPETSPNRPSDAARSENLPRKADSPAAADLAGSAEPNAPSEPRYRLSPTPRPVRDWTNYLPDSQTDYVAEAPADGRDDDPISTSPAGSESTFQRDAADGSLTFPTDPSSQF